MPWCAFALYAHVALARALGVVGVVEAAFVSVAALPFWRALCRRPAFQPLAALLRRFHAKRRLHPFEETREDDTRGDGEPLGFRLDWRVGFEKRVPDAQAELAAFVAEHARGDAPREASETTRVRDPASRLVASGFRVFPLCDETLVAPNAAAARHFPATCAAVSAAGGFGARLWVLSPGTRGGARGASGLSRGVSDGYWRAHVALDADLADVEARTSADESHAQLPSRETATDACDVSARATLGERAGIRCGDEMRRAEIGDVIVVNDGSFERAWFHETPLSNAHSRASAKASGRLPEGRGSRPFETVAGARKAGDDSREKKKDARDARVARVGAAVVLTFDVLRPEHAACRSRYVRHKARLVREAGDTNAGERTWRSLALAALGNLS